jgi:translation initiation factor IF-2
LSKKPASLKVHQLAKELSVSSKDIVTRCQQEEIPDIVNHLSPVSVGLALTVREWFRNAGGGAGEAASSGESADEGSATATIAPAKKTSSKKGASGKLASEDSDAGGASDASTEADAAAPRRAKRKPAAEGGGFEETTPAQPAEPVQVAEQSSAPQAAAAPSEAAAASAGAPPAAAEPKAAVAAPEQGAVVVQPPARTAVQRMPAGLTARPTARPDAPTASAKPAEVSQLVAARRVITAPPPPPQSLTDGSGPPPVMNVPKRPTMVGPVGPQLGALEKTKLSGPQVVRVEKADNLPAPPPMRRTGPGAGPTGPGARGGRVGTGGRPEVRGRGGIGSSRTGRAGDSARQAYGAQDIRDRQQRLATSRGFMTSHQSMRGGGGLGGGGGQRMERKPGEVQQVHVAEPLTIKELSAATGVKSSDIIKKLFLGGTMANINSAIDREKAIEIMMDFDIDLIVEEAKSAAEIIEERFKDRERVDERRRAPIVTILGHVDHGKTSLLDRIRSTNIAAGEAGGITQSTRAFSVPVKAGNVDRVVTFIDTPGHEAFTSMRARGAKVTDIVVLVVSAVDGVMPQTIESINHAKAAGVPIVVAMNKIDRPDATEANIRRLLGQLAEHELNPVEWGGTTEVIKTSAIRGDGIQELLEMLDYQAELLELKADFGGMARGTVLEAAIEEGRGPVARVMVQEGRLKKGDFIVIGRGYGRVRDIINDRGERITEAFPSTPVAISGIDQLPDAGDKAFVVESIRAAEEAAEERRRIDRERELAAPKITLDNIFKHLEKAGRKELALVVKGDVQGSVEALKAMLAKLPTEEVVVSVKSASAGGINESDITLAEATKAIVVGFNVTSSSKARQMAESKGIEIRLYEVIYDLIDDVTKAARGLLAPELKLEVLGHAEVRQVFKISKVGAIAGCYVTDGVVERNAQIRVTRNGIVVEKDRRLEQLKRFKDDAKEVRAGNECGMKIVGYDDIKAGDVLECYKTVTVQRS